MHGRVITLDTEIMKLKPFLLTLSMASASRPPPVDSGSPTPKDAPGVPSSPILTTNKLTTKTIGESKKGKESASAAEEPRFRATSASLQPTAAAPQLRPAFPLETQSSSYEELLHQYSYTHPTYTYSHLPSYPGLDPSKASNPYIAYSLYHNRAIAQGDYQTTTSNAVPGMGPPLAGGAPPPTITNRPTRRKTPQLLTADARVDHLMLAARKIGRERAAHLSSFAKQPFYAQGPAEGQAKGQDGSHVDRFTEEVYQPLASSQQPQSCTHDDSRIHGKSTIGPFNGQMHQQKMLPGATPSTPRQQEPWSHHTPLDSLVDAALREERRNQESTTVTLRVALGRRRRVTETEQPEAPSAKRRRSNATKEPAKANLRGHGSLDMLADQAQAAAPMSEGRQSTNRKVTEKQTSSSGSTGNGKSRVPKGKAKAKEPNLVEEREGQAIGTEGSSTGLTPGSKSSRSKKPTAARKGSTSQAPKNPKVTPKRTRPPPRDRTLPVSDVLSSGPTFKAKVRGNRDVNSASNSRMDASAESPESRTTADVYEGPRIIRGPSEPSGDVPGADAVQPSTAPAELEAKISDLPVRISGREEMEHEEQIDKASSPADSAIDFVKPNLLANLTGVEPLLEEYQREQRLEGNGLPRSSDDMAMAVQLVSDGQVDASDQNLVAGDTNHGDVIMGDAAAVASPSPQVPSSPTNMKVPSMTISISSPIGANADLGVMEGEETPAAASGCKFTATLLDASEHEQGVVSSSQDPTTSPPALRSLIPDDQEEQPRNEDSQITVNVNSRHDSDLDAEAEDDDGDMDADGEDEDQEGVEVTWSPIAYSSANVSNPLGAVPPIDEDADADAEGEVEDESEGPPEAIFRPSELASGTG
jgi:hypothetical protein